MTAQTKQEELVEKIGLESIAAQLGKEPSYAYGIAKEIEELINSEVLSALAEIKTPTINDVFPEKPYDGTNTYTDMKQVVDYYESQIQSIKNRYKL